ncbi:putative caspase recruitment domain member 6 [Diplodia corticola]|uniref:Putative caspase recruitment domain member 6 n=1 Tax=Diplodia corticola TaxID=236234 RepID=A0A1J9RS09_9PEZI|nr:putative caspase recruitment domain member 6 [Diplodia corticola]OJD35331.1 putative caspase recruitment domain member 6 [Diplodia corticola]
MDGLGITFARAWAAKAKASIPKQVPSQQQSSSPPSSELPQSHTSLRPRSSTQTSNDSYMEKRLSEFQDWKQKITKDFSGRKSTKPSLKEEPEPITPTESHVKYTSSDPTQQFPPAAESHGIENNASDPSCQPQTQVLTPRQSSLQSLPPQSPPPQSPQQQSPQQRSPQQQSPQSKRSPQTPPAVREKARILALRARALPKPDIRTHPAFQLQHVRVRKKTYTTKSDLKCWRPTHESSDDQMWGCCEKMGVENICEDCGYVLCTICGSRCRGEEWCVIQGCMRCQTRLGVNICTPHLRELRARSMERFHGHLVEPSALFLIEKL